MRIVLADVRSQFVESTSAGPMVVPGLLGPDGVHPAPSGYDVMAVVYRKAVEAALAA